MRAKILIIDDEESICEILRYNLEKEGYDVDTVLSAEKALTMDLYSYSLFIVDIMMDRINGHDFVRYLRDIEELKHIPVLFCSALGGEDDTVMGLNLGGDDYVSKPFSIPEIIARVRSLLRRSLLNDQVRENRSKAHYESSIVFKGLRVDRNEKLCYINGENKELSKTEFDLLLFFLEHRNKVYSREEIISFVWGSQKNVTVSSRTVDTSLARLRKKIGEYGQHIETRIGFGYEFKEVL